MTALLITGGRVIDPANQLDASADVLVLDGAIAAVGQDARQKSPADRKSTRLNSSH